MQQAICLGCSAAELGCGCTAATKALVLPAVCKPAAGEGSSAEQSSYRSFAENHNSGCRDCVLVHAQAHGRSYCLSCGLQCSLSATRATPSPRLLPCWPAVTCPCALWHLWMMSLKVSSGLAAASHSLQCCMHTCWSSNTHAAANMVPLSWSQAPDMIDSCSLKPPPLRPLSQSKPYCSVAAAGLLLSALALSMAASAQRLVPEPLTFAVRALASATTAPGWATATSSRPSQRQMLPACCSALASKHFLTHARGKSKALFAGRPSSITCAWLQHVPFARWACQTAGQATCSLMQARQRPGCALQPSGAACPQLWPR